MNKLPELLSQYGSTNAERSSEWESCANHGVTTSINPGSHLYGLGYDEYLGTDCSSIDREKSDTPQKS